MTVPTTDADINIEITGQGPALVLIHGWGMHGGFFNSIIEIIKDKFTVYNVDLPGHGKSTEYQGLADLDAVTHHVISKITSLTNNTIFISGWSMGGLIAQRAAMLYPELISKLILVSSTACFENKDDWCYGIDPDILSLFSNELKKEYPATLDRFLALQFMGSAQQKQNLRAARDLLALKPAPGITALQQGLQLLINTDLRSQLCDIKCPCLIAGGERDTLVPTKALRYLTEHLSQARCFIFKGSSHAPFLTHSAAFTARIENFLL